MIQHLKNHRQYFNHSFTWLLFFLIIIVAASCKVTRPSNYFYNISRDTTISGTKQTILPLKIKTGDGLSIAISSLNKEEDALYASSLTAGVSGAGGTLPGLLVNDAGEIYVHKLGKIKVAGLTRNELKLQLEKDLLPFLKDPIVAINFTNHHLTVIGEIGLSQVLPIPDEKISIIDVMAKSGSALKTSQLTNVLIIREQDNSKDFKHVNLEDNSIFSSPYYYLQPNDVVVISPNEKVVKEEQQRTQYLQTSAFILQFLSISIIIDQTFFRK